MYILEFASHPHLWGTRSPSLASVTPLAELAVIDKCKKYLARVHRSQGAGMESSQHEPMGAEKSIGAGRGYSEIKLINGVCLRRLSAVKRRGPTTAHFHRLNLEEDKRDFSP